VAAPSKVAAPAVPASEVPSAPSEVASPKVEDPAAADVAAIERDVVGAADRSADDKALDAGRKPAEVLAFFGIRPGMKVAEIGAGGGYTTELLVRRVGDAGQVYGQNSKLILERFAEKPWSERLKKPVMKNVVRLDREFDEPFPDTVRDLDAVLVVMFYHDTVWQKVDRERMNRNVFASLRSGGVYGIIDHSGRAGTGATETETLHRIEESFVKDEIEKAGFRLQASSDFLRHPADTRDWNPSPRAAAERRGTSDRFVLKFVKP
jgi:predicted methyltransferase